MRPTEGKNDNTRDEQKDKNLIDEGKKAGPTNEPEVDRQELDKGSSEEKFDRFRKK